MLGIVPEDWSIVRRTKCFKKKVVYSEMDTAKFTDRNIYLDVVKVFTIVCVVLGHCIQYGSGKTYLNGGLFFDDIVFKIIYSFHMPLFMIISGYLFAFTIKTRDY